MEGQMYEAPHWEWQRPGHEAKAVRVTETKEREVSEPNGMSEILVTILKSVCEAHLLVASFRRKEYDDVDGFRDTMVETVQAVLDSPEWSALCEMSAHIRIMSAREPAAMVEVFKRGHTPPDSWAEPFPGRLFIADWFSRDYEEAMADLPALPEQS